MKEYYIAKFGVKCGPNPIYIIPTHNPSQRSNLWGKPNKIFEQIHYQLSNSNNGVRPIFSLRVGKNILYLSLWHTVHENNP